MCNFNLHCVLFFIFYCFMPFCFLSPLSFSLIRSHKIWKCRKLHFLLMLSNCTRKTISKSKIQIFNIMQMRQFHLICFIAQYLCALKKKDDSNLIFGMSGAAVIAFLLILCWFYSSYNWITVVVNELHVKQYSKRLFSFFYPSHCNCFNVI